MSITLKWKSQIATVDFKVEAAKYGDKDWPFHVTLLDLLKRISDSSKVPIENMKLLHSGGKVFSCEPEPIYFKI